MSSKSKQKGDRFEREMVAFLKNNKISAKKIYLADQASGNIRGDIQYGDNLEFTAEAKHRESISKTLWEWVSGVNILFLKRNNYKPLIVMPLEEFERLYKLSQDHQQ